MDLPLGSTLSPSLARAQALWLGVAVTLTRTLTMFLHTDLQPKLEPGPEMTRLALAKTTTALAGKGRSFYD